MMESLKEQEGAEQAEVLAAFKKWNNEGVVYYQSEMSRQSLLEMAAKARYSSVSELIENAEKLERWLGYGAK